MSIHPEAPRRSDPNWTFSRVSDVVTIDLTVVSGACMCGLVHMCLCTVVSAHRVEVQSITNDRFWWGEEGEVEGKVTTTVKWKGQTVGGNEGRWVRKLMLNAKKGREKKRWRTVCHFFLLVQGQKGSESQTLDLNSIWVGTKFTSE